MTATSGTLRRELGRLRAAVGLTPAGDRTGPFRADPAAILARAGIPPDQWQSTILRSPSRRVLMTCSRQVGKSTTAAGLALREAMLCPGALVLLLSPSLRQSGELFRKVLALFNALGRPVSLARETATALEFATGSRVVSLPESESGIRGFSGVRLLVIDEAARVADDVYRAVRPMLATSGGGLVALSSPFGKRGWYYDEWTGSADWARVKVTADECPRIAPEFLAEEQVALGSRWYLQEYFCSFEDAIGAVFADSDIEAALSADVAPLAFGGKR